MMRFIGILTGVLLTLGLYLLYPSDQPAPDKLVPETAPPAVPVPDMAQFTAPPSSSMATSGSKQVSRVPSLQDEQESSPDPLSVNIPTINSATNSAVFWHPFNSHYSAAGFAERMQFATGIEIRPVKIGESSYKVAFDYLDETDRIAKFSIIRDITGLKINEEAQP